MQIDKNKHYYLSFSGGKDSTASAIIAHELGLNFTIVHSLFYFDKSRNIPAVLPEHHNFIFDVAIPKFKSWGNDVIICEPDSDYVTEFFKIKMRGNNKGKILGFPLPMKSSCWANSRLKVKSIKKVMQIVGQEPQIIGIAADELERAERILDQNKISLLVESNITEKQCYQICENYGLLSPLYNNLTRDGCWFCNQMGIKSSNYICRKYPELIEELKKLEAVHQSQYPFTFAMNYQTVDQFYHRQYKKIYIYENQMSFFDE